MIWVYGICERPELPPPRRRGLAQAPLDGVRDGDLLAVISRHVHPPGDPALDALWVHERVVERIMVDRAVLPMRFGTKVADDDALREVLAAPDDHNPPAIDHELGSDDHGVRAQQQHPSRPDTAALPAELPAPVPTTGRAYLEAKIRNGQRVDRWIAALHEPLASLAVAISRQPQRGPEEVLRASYLVETAVMARFRSTVERLQRAHPDVAILCTGPWPPYSFVGGTAALTIAPEPRESR